MALRPDFTGVLKGRGFQPRRCAAKWVAALQFAERLSGSPCSIVLVIPTPNAAEESATPKSSVCTTYLDNSRICERTVRRRNDKTWVFGFSRQARRPTQYPPDEASMPNPYKVL